MTLGPRWFIACVVIVSASAPAVPAAPLYRVHWTAPGWYVVEDNPGGLFLYAGPHETATVCERDKPADEEEAIFECQRLDDRPDWDRD